MKHTLSTYPARQYSTRNRRRHTRARRVLLALLILAALVLFWAGVAFLAF